MKYKRKSFIFIRRKDLRQNEQKTNDTAFSYYDAFIDLV